MLEILKKGGDTDTNACIVGGLIGAVIGEKNIPKNMLVKCLNYEPNYNRK